MEEVLRKILYGTLGKYSIEIPSIDILLEYFNNQYNNKVFDFESFENISIEDNKISKEEIIKNELPLLFIYTLKNIQDSINKELYYKDCRVMSMDFFNNTFILHFENAGRVYIPLNEITCNPNISVNKQQIKSQDDAILNIIDILFSLNI